MDDYHDVISEEMGVGQGLSEQREETERVKGGEYGREGPPTRYRGGEGKRVRRGSGRGGKEREWERCRTAREEERKGERRRRG